LPFDRALRSAILLENKSPEIRRLLEAVIAAFGPDTFPVSQPQITFSLTGRG
jgi:hypothetical protein